MVDLKVGHEYYYEGDILLYVEDVQSMEGWCVVDEGGDYGSLRVVRKKDLIRKEDSWQWQQKQKYADELRLITQKAQENLDKLTDKLVDKALISLSSRLKFNALFGKGSGNMSWVGVVVDELEKLVKEKAPEVVKGEKDPF